MKADPGSFSFRQTKGKCVVILKNQSKITNPGMKLNEMRICFSSEFQFVFFLVDKA